jgi:hypothetical protein
MKSRGLRGSIARAGGVVALAMGAASAAQAATASVCIRNDGAGSFSGTDLDFLADTSPASGVVSDSGPNTTVAPGNGTCFTMYGLTAANSYGQYLYTFSIEFWDTSGIATFSSPSALALTNSGTWYISSTGASQSMPTLGNYISVANAAPPPYSVNAYATLPDTDTNCYVWWTGVSPMPNDWNHNLLQRSSSSSGPWTTVYSQYSWGFQNATDSGLSPGTTYWYRVLTVDDYDAEGTSGAVSCTTTNNSGGDDDDATTPPVDDDDATTPPGDDDDATTPPADDDDATTPTADDDDDATTPVPDDDDATTAPPLYEGDEPGECSDGADNDQDGLFDCDDDGCAGSPDCDGATSDDDDSESGRGRRGAGGCGACGGAGQSNAAGALRREPPPFVLALSVLAAALLRRPRRAGRRRRGLVTRMPGGSIDHERHSESCAHAHGDATVPTALRP